MYNGVDMRKAKMNMGSKVAKYFVAHKVKGLSKTKAAKVAGISRIENVTNYERMPTFQALEEKYKDRLLKHIGLDEVAEEQVKVIKQDKDLSAKNNAIKFFVERVEPEVHKSDDDERMVVVIRG